MAYHIFLSRYVERYLKIDNKAIILQLHTIDPYLFTNNVVVNMPYLHLEYHFSSVVSLECKNCQYMKDPSIILIKKRF